MRFLLNPARYTSIALATALLCQAAWITPARASNADEEDLQQAFGEPPMISVVTGTRQLVRRAPAVATVITKQAEEQGGKDGHKDGSIWLADLGIQHRNVAGTGFARQSPIR